MTTSRRSLIAAGAALALPGEAFAAWPFAAKAPVGCRGRAAYAGGALRAQVATTIFDDAARAGMARATPYASDILDLRFEKTAKAMKSRSFTAAVARFDGTLWTAAQGAAPAAFAWPGLGEVLLATVVLQLVEEGKLTLETPIAPWAADIPTAKWITVEDLLSHVSGLSAPTGAPAYCPGAGWEPAALDVQLLSRIVQAVDGQPPAASAGKRIVERLDLKETALAASADGGLAVTAAASDVVRIWRALLGGRLHSAEMARRRFLRLYPMTAAPVRNWWGLGVMVCDLTADKWNPADVWLGLSRVAGETGAVVAYSPARRAFAALALTGLGSADAALDLLLLDVPADPSVLRFTPVPPRPAKRPRRAPTPKTRRP
jgi:D-alanyl-D-alanine carboxypeptidase